MTSPAARRAFDIHAEPDRLRDEYGRNTLGQSCLMARRLVEAGVRCVTIDHTNWDTHDNNFATLKPRACCRPSTAACRPCSATWPTAACSTATLVVVTGEFGRTPRINSNAGRDHWGPAFTVALGGGGIKGGRVIGASRRPRRTPRRRPARPRKPVRHDLPPAGHRPGEEFHTPEGRPVQIVNNGRVIDGLL